MGILDFNLDDVPELGIVPDGEYQITITSTDARLDKNGNPGALIRFSTGQPDTKQVTTWISIPSDSDDEETAKNKLRRIKALNAAFGLGAGTAQEFLDNMDNHVGKSGFAVLSAVIDEEYGEQNKLGRFVTAQAGA